MNIPAMMRIRSSGFRCSKLARDGYPPKNEGLAVSRTVAVELSRLLHWATSELGPPIEIGGCISRRERVDLYGDLPRSHHECRNRSTGNKPRKILKNSIYVTFPFSLSLSLSLSITLSLSLSPSPSLSRSLSFSFSFSLSLFLVHQKFSMRGLIEWGPELDLDCSNELTFKTFLVSTKCRTCWKKFPNKNISGLEIIFLIKYGNISF